MASSNAPIVTAHQTSIIILPVWTRRQDLSLGQDKVSSMVATSGKLYILLLQKCFFMTGRHESITKQKNSYEAASAKALDSLLILYDLAVVLNMTIRGI